MKPGQEKSISEDVITLGRKEMFKAFISIVFFILAGIPIYIIEVISFYNPVELDHSKLWVMAMLCIPALILSLTGHALLKFVHWRRRTGVLLVSSTLFAIFIGVMMLWMSLSPDFGEAFGHEALPRFTDYSLGVPFTASVLFLGLFLCLADRTFPE